MFRTVPLSIIRSFSLYTQEWYISYRFCWHTPLLCVLWKTPDDGQRNFPKHVAFYSKNKFEKLVHLVGFIIRIFISSLKNPWIISWDIVVLNIVQNWWKHSRRCSLRACLVCSFACLTIRLQFNGLFIAFCTSTFWAISYYKYNIVHKRV